MFKAVGAPQNFTHMPDAFLLLDRFTLPMRMHIALQLPQQFPASVVQDINQFLPHFISKLLKNSAVPMHSILDYGLSGIWSAKGISIMEDAPDPESLCMQLNAECCTQRQDARDLYAPLKHRITVTTPLGTVPDG